MASSLRRICIRPYDADVEYLQEMSRITGVGFNRLVRETLHKVVVQLRDQERRHLDQIPSLTALGPIEIELEDVKAAE